MPVAIRNRRVAGTFTLIALTLAGSAGLALASAGSNTGTTAAASVGAKKAEYVVDAVHSAAIFRIKHNEASYNYGRFVGIEGTVVYDASEGVLGVDVTVDTNSVDTANDKRDAHLRSPDFFNTKQFPKATFKSTAVAKKGEHAYDVTGDFTLNGVTKPVTVTLEHTGDGKSMQGGDVAGFETTFSLNRSDYGMTKYLPMVGDEVRLTIALEAAKQ